MSEHRFFGKESNNLYKFKDLDKVKLSTSFNKTRKPITFRNNWFRNYTINSKEVSINFFNSIPSMSLDRSQSYNKMIQKVIRIYIESSINKYLKKINKV